MQTVISSQINTDEHIDWTAKDPLIKPERKDIIVIAGERGGIEYRGFSNLLDFYYHRNHIESNQYRAGLKLYKLWYYSCLKERYVVSSYGDSPRGEVDYHEIAIRPLEFINAKMAISNPFSRIAVLCVVCEGKSPGRRKMGLVHNGLNDLIEHFK